MAKYTFSATVNYPDDRDVETPTFEGQSIDGLAKLFWRLVSTEHDLTSAVITIVKQKEDKQCKHSSISSEDTA